VLIIGANKVCIAIGKVLQQQGFRVRLTSSTWSEIQEARMAGLDTYFGNPVSVHADNYLDLIGIGRLFAMSRRPALNALACLKFRNEFGRNRVFSLRVAEEQDESEKGRLAESYRVPRLFGGDVTIQKLGSLLGQGGEVRATKLTESFGEAAYQEHYNGAIVRMFVIDERGRLRAVTDEFSPPLEEGSTIVSLIPADKLSKPDQGEQK